MIGDWLFRGSISQLVGEYCVSGGGINQDRRQKTYLV